MKIFNKYGCLTCSLALISIILCSAYVYYGIIIKYGIFLRMVMYHCQDAMLRNYI